jgi:F-type H+-transporting ATPase subunit b
MLASATTWVAVAFIIFMAMVAYWGLRPILKGLDGRADRIRKEIREAEQLREEAQQQLADYKRRQREAQSEAEGIIEHAKAEAKRMREQAEKDIAAQLERRERQTLDKIQQAEQQAIRDLRERAVDIATAATAELLKENISEKKASDLVDGAIKELPERLN